MAYTTFTPIIFPGETALTNALGIDNLDVIVGFHGTTNTAFSTTFPTSASSFKTLIPAGTTVGTTTVAMSQAVGVNNLNTETVGFLVDTNGTTHGYIITPAGLSLADETNTAFNQLLGVNDTGNIVGYSSLDPAGQTMQLAYERLANGTYTLLDNAAHTLVLPANVNSQATGINDGGDIVGFFMPTATTSDGFLLSNGKLTTLEFPGSTFTQALGINNRGQVSGFYNDANGATHGFTWSNGNWTSIDVPGATSTTINGINDFGQVAGFDTMGAVTAGFEANLPVIQVADTTTNTAWQQTLTPYTGPVTYLNGEFIDINPDNLNMTSAVPNVFLHSGPGEDALLVTSGQNVLDGGTGSNFLTDGSGQDTDFVDARGASTDIWSTLNNFKSGDSATLWGITPQELQPWVDGQGAVGFTGLTEHIPLPGTTANASLTLAGYTTADLTNGKLSVSFGTDPASGSPYMFVHAT
jgi:probable HAF family extracellular repeat protein